MVTATGKHPLLLASSSPRRLQLLQQVGITPDLVMGADIDETPFPREIPADYALRIATEKAEKLKQTHPAHTILSADTVVACGRRILPKAETPEEAILCLQLLSGRRHRVMTAVCLSLPGVENVRSKLVTSTVKFRRLSTQDIDAYIASGEWQGKAGGYAIQGLAAGYISHIGGSYSGIVGLPLFETLNMLRSAS